MYSLDGAVLSEISGSTARDYVYGAAGEVIYMHTSGGSGRYLVTDFRNSVIAKINSDGTLTQIDYNAWGEPTVSQGGDLEGLSVLWNGYYYDDETGSYYLRNRFYSPQERCFITEDPRGVNPDGNWNNRFAVHTQYGDGYGLSVYAKGDPVNGRDDWGLCQKTLKIYGHGLDPEEDLNKRTLARGAIPKAMTNGIHSELVLTSNDISSKCSSLCCNATLKLYGCGIGKNDEYMRRIASGCSKIKRVCGYTRMLRYFWGTNFTFSLPRRWHCIDVNGG